MKAHSSILVKTKENGRVIAPKYKGVTKYNGVSYFTKDFSTKIQAEIQMDIKRLELGLEPLRLKKV
jgi:hypothetical protein